MKLADIKNFKNKTARAIRDGHIYKALRDMRAFSESLLDWETTTAIDSLLQNYSYMLQYVASGVEDPGQKAVYDSMVIDALSIVDKLTRKAFMAENPSLYYSMARTMDSRNSIASLASAYMKECLRLDSDLESITNPRRTETAERILRELFNRLWIQHPFTTEDSGAIAMLLDPKNRQTVPVYARCVIVSGIMMGLLEFYDVRRHEILLTTYLSDDDDTVRLRALVGALATFYRYRSRPIPKDVALKLAAVKEHPDWNDDFIAVTAEFMRATDTDRISSEMQSRIADTIKNIDPELRKKLQSGDFDMESITEGNPEWEESLANSELTRSLKEMQEIQADGGDVFMASFSRMKQFPFFSEISNWFLPFYENYSAVAEIDNIEGTIGYMLSKMPILCDSDKFSIVMSFGAVPSSNREAFVNALNMQSEQMREALSQVERISPLQTRRNTINKYVQDLYRFYKLFRRKNEFFPLFSQTPDLLEVKVLGDDFKDEARLGMIAEFFFKHEFWSQAADAFARLDSVAMPEAARSQKMAYALEMEGKLSEAIARYEEAELLNGGSIWTLKHMASALRRNGQSKRAASYYKRLSEQLPDDGSIALNYGYALTEAGMMDEAEAQFHKAAYLMPDSYKPLRGLAWTQFRNKKFDVALDTYAKFISDGNEDDYLNYGHVQLASGDVKNAIDSYRAYIDNFGKDIEAALAADEKYLKDAGVDTAKLPLIIEAVKYAK